MIIVKFSYQMKQKKFRIVLWKIKFFSLIVNDLFWKLLNRGLVFLVITFLSPETSPACTREWSEYWSMCFFILIKTNKENFRAKFYIKTHNTHFSSTRKNQRNTNGEKNGKIDMNTHKIHTNTYIQRRFYFYCLTPSPLPLPKWRSKKKKYIYLKRKKMKNTCDIFFFD